MVVKVMTKAERFEERLKALAQRLRGQEKETDEMDFREGLEEGREWALMADLWHFRRCKEAMYAFYFRAEPGEGWDAIMEVIRLDHRHFRSSNILPEIRSDAYAKGFLEAFSKVWRLVQDRI